MTYEGEISAMQREIKSLQLANEARHEMITAICQEVDRLHDRIDKLVEQNNREHAKMNERHKTAESIQDTIGEKLYTIFYTVFPGALEADKTLDRITKEQQAKKPPR